jgi:multidrug resistance efflux pump
VLLRLDSRRSDHEIAKVRRGLQAARAEHEKLGQISVLQQSQFHAARTKAVAEFDQAATETVRARQAQDSDIRRALIEVATARDRHGRSEKLDASRAISQQQMIEAKANLRTAEENLRRARVPIDVGHLNVLQRAIELIDRDYAVRTAELESRIIAKQQEVDNAIKDLANLERQSEQAILRSPVNGIVTKGQYHVGDVVPLGDPVFEIAPKGGYCFEATVDSRDMGLVHVNMPARVKLDAYDYQLYGSLSGHVFFISPDTNHKALEDPTNRKTIYRVKVSLTSDVIGHAEFRGAVKLGMAGQVEIITDRRTLLSILIKRIRSSISFG